MKKILVLSFSDLVRDPRVYRQIRLLSEQYSVTAFGLGDPKISGVEFLLAQETSRSLFGKMIAGCLLKLGMFEWFYWSVNSVKNAYQLLNGREFDLMVANDLNTLPLALRLANSKAKVVFDAHEYSPRELEDRFLWRLFFQKFNHYLCQRYLPKVDGMMTVCKGIADEYQKIYSIDSVVVTNAPPYHDLQPSPVENESIHMIHHGGAMPSRHLEKMIEMMDYLDERFYLDFMLMPSDPKYFEHLKKLAANNKRIQFVDPVAMQDIPKACNQYDIGLFLLPPVNFNYLHALPNKLFEFIQSRLAIAIGPSPEMQRLVIKYDCGVVAEDFTPQSMAKSLASLTADRICYYKQQTHRAAVEQSAEHNAVKIINLIGGY